MSEDTELGRICDEVCSMIRQQPLSPVRLLDYAERVARALAAQGLERQELLPLLEGFSQLERLRTLEGAESPDLAVQHKQQWLQLKLALAVTDPQQGRSAERKRHALYQLASQLLRPWLTGGVHSQDDVRYYREFVQAIVSDVHSVS